MRTFNRFHRRLGTDTPVPGQARAAAIALGTGALMAIGKTVAAMYTGSASMSAEAVHSWVATVTEIFLIAAYLAARRPADSGHPLGYGRESYVWSLFASIGMFVVGAQVGFWRGLRQLDLPDATTDYRFGYIVIAISFGLQFVSFMQAIRFVRERAAERDLGVFKHVFDTSDSQLRAVVTGDFIALVGLAVAGMGMALHQITGQVAYDAAGSMLIGLLMGVAGLFLINVNRHYLAGMPLSKERSAAAVKALEAVPLVERVTFFFAEFVGPDRLIVVVRVVIAGEHDQATLSRILHGLETRIMEHKSVARAIVALATPEEMERVR
ncbi:cation diffusion facilitator family transporter [Variovorax sp. Sphag1AA]|uniref:cation diffusion facilitator family transporter n=1 Tax=Variovorax sp. Sphag1AA TaxID=2587027 RepID=UPI00162219DD|nr:cation transporter [Variovorax sp. Sphag1AA]MBB3177182.1 cation diffusion facilitator family transporter [Variovorax sp. Sphag1AA]